MSLRDMAEARIQAWMATPEEERPPPPDVEGVKPLEVELLEAIERHLTAARMATDPETAHAEGTRAREAETRLFVLLDATGRSVLAPHFAELVADLRSR